MSETARLGDETVRWLAEQEWDVDDYLEWRRQLLMEHPEYAGKPEWERPESIRIDLNAPDSFEQLIRILKARKS